MNRMRLIDADALYEKACDLEAQALDYAVKISNDEEKREEWLKWSTILTERTAFKYDVNDAPTIEERKTGHWILHTEQEKNIFGVKQIECSECGDKCLVQFVEKEKYCRNCGADMRGEQDV